VSALKLAAPMTILSNVSCKEAMEIMKKEGYDQVPVVDEAGYVMKNLT
jgi:cystathionine beta-synthase